MIQSDLFCIQAPANALHKMSWPAFEEICALFQERHFADWMDAQDTIDCTDPEEEDFEDFDL